MMFASEGIGAFPQPCTRGALYDALTKNTIIESRTLLLNSQHQLCFRLGEYEGILPAEKCSDSKIRESAILARVGYFSCFCIESIDEENKKVWLSRAKAQSLCREKYISLLNIGDIIPCRVTHLEPFGAFCDIGCGISALMPIDCLSVSRISHPRDRLYVGMQLRCLIQSRDDEGRLVLSLKELLGTWQDNAACFCAGQTAAGIVRGVESYGIFVELAPNLSGLAESISGIVTGQAVSVYIKNILPEKHKIKLAIMRQLEGEQIRLPLTYFCHANHMDTWDYYET